MRSLFYCAALLVFASAPRAQAQVCRPADDSSFDMIEMIKSYAIPSNSRYAAARDSLRIPAVSSPGSITLVTKEVTCKSANTAYQKVATGARETLSGRVYVVQVGTSFVVWDPAYRYNANSPAETYMVFDSKWIKQSIF
jgi:hypothetical protein